MANPQLGGIVDPVIRDEVPLHILASFLNLAQRCSCDQPMKRPLMREVERELEQIIGFRVARDVANPCGQKQFLDLKKHQEAFGSAS